MHNIRYKCKLIERIAVFTRFPLLPLTLAVMLAACGSDKTPHASPLHVVIRTTPAAWYFDGNTAKGIDHDLLVRFAASIGRKIEVSHVPNTPAALNALCNPQAQLAVGLLSLPAATKNQFHTAPDYGTVKQQLLYHFKQPRPSSTGDLVMENFETGNEPTQLETLLHIKQHNGDLTHWTLHRDFFPHDLIKSMNQGFIEYTIADSHVMTMTKRFYSHIKEAFYVGDELPLHWVFGDCVNAEVAAAAKTFFAGIKADHTLTQILDRYYGHATQLDYPEKLAFIKNVDLHLDQYRDLFMEAADEVNMDWLLLAAVSYQESHWKPEARSPSGVEGLMMVTLEIAQEFGIEDRRNPTQSVRAGTRFLLKLKNRLPPELEEPDRSWFALAAYNVGLEHIKRAMAAAHKEGLNPLLWVEVRDFLRRPAANEWLDAQPLNDPFTYVYNVRAYRDLLAWLEGTIRFTPPEKAPQEPAPSAGPLPM